ncbi:mob1 family protein [Ophiostoma piceae UAMH 11346]|uniref:Mob1 family protein n=1 Tax=Ophiostoma piceae (strain UAMH 11346) TaxID=1262450 RepID=S3C5E1_OPHP1|nr:mob1 family protein [Ophiostoma piceae UAMH 11346]
MMALPPTSPRLPSPPPAAEIQIGPKSPAMPGATLAQQQMEQQMEQTILDANSKRRIHPGTRASDFAAGPPLVPLNELDSAFQLQEHLSALHYFHTGSNTQAITRDTALLLAQAPVGTDRTLWLYELCRFLIAQCNSLIIGFLFDTPPCSAATCPEMRASEWQFLCAVHEQPRSCCAIDYCCHTLDWAANVVTNPKIFPSRFAFADQHDKNAATKNLINVFRRLHRIFAHAWFQHRGVFWSVEGQTGLYVFFKTVCDMYDLLPAENYKLPPEAEGLDTAGSVASAAVGGVESTAPTGVGSTESTPGLIPMAAITDRKGMGFSAGVLNHRPGAGVGGGLGTDLLSGENSVGRTNTRRHIRSSPSTGSAVTTVLEQDEDSSSPFGSSRPLTILQHADRLSTPLSRGAAVPPPAPTPPTAQDKPADVSESKALADEAANTAETVETVAAKEDTEPAEEPAVVEKDTASESAKEGEAPTTEGAVEEEGVPQVDSAQVAEAKPEAGEDTSAAAEEPVAEASDKDAETAEPLSEAPATEAAIEETSEEPAQESEPEAAAKEETTDEEAKEAAEPEVGAVAADDTKPESSDGVASEDASPAAADDRDEADKPSSTAKAEPAGED